MLEPEALEQRLKEFFEDYPLYKRLKAEFPNDWGKIPMPAIQLACPSCNGTRTFNFGPKRPSDLDKRRDAAWKFDERFMPPASSTVPVPYHCAACGAYVDLLLRFGPLKQHVVDGVEKVGQYPRHEQADVRALKPLLKQHYAFFERGAACEAEGFGLAAHAYYRRVVEDLLDDLAARKKARLGGEALAAFEAELAKVEENWSGTRMIDLIKDVLPPETRPGGANPLGLLYGTLSEGLHGKTEEECLDLARDLHVLLVGLFKQLDAADQTRQFKDQLRAVEEKRRRQAKTE